MKTYYDVQQLLKQFGTFVYTGNRGADIDLMEEEVKELFEWGMLDRQTYQETRLILKQERSKE
ncbi:YqgQ family protein [Texcoconibacillus texcoconensis]|uniref:Uncharacterized protein YqgQ n=1 Tax=Texcoconibacillus texcoconensis TaxID=1095777 RepID=A0A840QP13_9BACI|nr:YqgQ family protein [Texcoconibacillus texcoconensis]MBB5173122.1 uncharacterized protein YqgQ [Texcoconibacillus texcoconensis]